MTTPMGSGDAPDVRHERQRPLRVAHVSAWWKGGAVAMIRIHDGLRESGIDSRIHCIEPIEGSLPNAHDLRRIRPTIRQKWLRTLRLDSHTWSRRIKRARRSNPPCEVFSPPVAINPHDVSAVTRDVDVIHLHWVGGYFDFKTFFESVSVPVVWTLHDQNPYFGGFHYQGDLDAATTLLPLEHELRSIKRDALSSINLGIAANSRWNHDLTQSTDVLPSTAIRDTVYLPLPIDSYVPIAKRVAKQELSIMPERFIVGFACASIDNRRKGFYDLIEALDLLPNRVKANTTLLSFGRDPDKDLQQKVGVQWRHLGHLEPGMDQSRAYSAMDTFVTPSVEEAFGQTPLEALACKTSVIGTRVGGIPETVLEERTGLLVPARSPQRIADAIVRMHDSPELRERCGIAGRELASTRHAPESIARQYIGLYDRLLERHASFCHQNVRHAA
ncbi:MAG: glycosyltransferase [Planctomycetota bacterium]